LFAKIKQKNEIAPKDNQPLAVSKRLKGDTDGQASNMTYKPSIKTKGVYEEQ
jgi:hypothetical protein